ncbi:hypothetical protein OAS86_06930 [Gammaproteobacteria bacterium]|nr:hypothetical protein [Gammaproteobacteria bacterium]
MNKNRLTIFSKNASQALLLFLIALPALADVKLASRDRMLADASPEATLEVEGETLDTGAPILRAQGLLGSDVLAVLDSGDVGINTITAAKRLDVEAGSGKSSSPSGLRVRQLTPSSATSLGAEIGVDASGTVVIRSASLSPAEVPLIQANGSVGVFDTAGAANQVVTSDGEYGTSYIDLTSRFNSSVVPINSAKNLAYYSGIATYIFRGALRQLTSVAVGAGAGGDGGTSNFTAGFDEISSWMMWRDTDGKLYRGYWFRSDQFNDVNNVLVWMQGFVL